MRVPRKTAFRLTAGGTPANPRGSYVQVHAKLEPLFSPALARLHHGPPQLALEVGLLRLAVHALVGGDVVTAHGSGLAVALKRGLLFRRLPLLAAGEPAGG
jgi:hypothetical protein